jgi:D-alanyl-D-alanine dipeptidase
MSTLYVRVLASSYCLAPGAHKSGALSIFPHLIAVISRLFITFASMKKQARILFLGAAAALLSVTFLPTGRAAEKSGQKTRLSATAQRMARDGYLNVKEQDPSIFVSLMYSRPDNFCGVVLYGDLREAYLHPKAMAALKRAQKRLKELRPDLSLKVYDAARPMSIQQKMWDKVKGTSKDIYVSNPAHGGGMHNYGMAVDITLCNLKGDTLDMGTKIDYMGSAAHIDREEQLVATHRISRRALRNRQLLREVMRYAGWRPLRTEWWHFNMCSRATAKKYYKVIR